MSDSRWHSREFHVNKRALLKSAFRTVLLIFLQSLTVEHIREFRAMVQGLGLVRNGLIQP